MSEQRGGETLVEYFEEVRRIFFKCLDNATPAFEVIADAVNKMVSIIYKEFDLAGILAPELARARKRPSRSARKHTRRVKAEARRKWL